MELFERMRIRDVDVDADAADVNDGDAGINTLDVGPVAGAGAGAGGFDVDVDAGAGGFDVAGINNAHDGGPVAGAGGPDAAGFGTGGTFATDADAAGSLGRSNFCGAVFEAHSGPTLLRFMIDTPNQHFERNSNHNNRNARESRYIVF